MLPTFILCGLCPVSKCLLHHRVTKILWKIQLKPMPAATLVQASSLVLCINCLFYLLSQIRTLVQSTMLLTRNHPVSFFYSGYNPSNAFDNNPETIWVSNGQAPPGMQWIAFEFDYPVSIGSIRIASEIDKPERAPTEIFVEGSCEKYFRTFETMWILRNPNQRSDMRQHAQINRRDASKPRFRRYR